MVGGIIETVTPWYPVEAGETPAPWKVLVAGTNQEAGEWRAVLVQENPGMTPGDRIWWDRHSAHWSRPGENQEQTIARAIPRTAWDPFSQKDGAQRARQTP